MPIELPTYEQIISRTRADISANIPEIDPTIHGSFERGFADSQSGRAFDIVQLLKQLIQQSNIQTASGDFVDTFASYENLTRNAATGATGTVIFTGTPTSTIPISTQIKSISTGVIYTTDSAAIIANQSISVSSITRVGTTATVTTGSNHQLSAGMTVNISGAVEIDYNGSFVVTVTGPNALTYTVQGNPTTPASGTITANFDGVSVAITAQSVGLETNLTLGAKVDLLVPLSGVDTSSLVAFEGLAGGLDLESDSELISRILSKRANPVTNFNVAAIEEKAFEIDGVTRVLVKRITPAVGDVTIYFVRDGDINIIPNGAQITAVKNSIVAILPATSGSGNVFVLAPVPITTNYAFLTLFPDTPTMRTAVTNQLKAFYAEDIAFETDVTQNAFNAAIQNTVDTVTGDKLSSFSLSSPVADIVVTTGQLGILGTITYP